MNHVLGFSNNVQKDCLRISVDCAGAQISWIAHTTLCFFTAYNNIKFRNHVPGFSNDTMKDGN